MHSSAANAQQKKHLTEGRNMKYIVEIRAGEGGEDAKLLVADQADIYIKFSKTLGATVSVENRGSL
jgi:protein subunit release factor A